MQTNRKVLFLCTGNYYRSRFAEEYFNHLARHKGSDWRADSAGLMVPETRHINPGTFSQHATAALESRDIMPAARNREPAPFVPESIEDFELCVALSDREHRPMFTRRFPELIDRVTFWTVEDIGFEDPTEATDRIAEAVEALFARLEG